MGIIDSIILTIYTLALAIVSGFMVVGAAFPEWVTPHLWIMDAMQSARGRLSIGLVGTVFFAVSVRLILFAFRRQGGGQPVVHETEMGEVRISLGAVENLVRKVARGVKGVRDVKAVVTHTRDGLHASLKGTISPEVSVPEVSAEIQTSVRQYVKRVVGVELADVRIEVENIANESRRTRLD